MYDSDGLAWRNTPILQKCEAATFSTHNLSREYPYHDGAEVRQRDAGFALKSMRCQLLSQKSQSWWARPRG
jgi:hypothetical protein